MHAKFPWFNSADSTILPAEILLFARTDGGSSGAIWKALNNSGLGSTSLCANKKAVNDCVLTPQEFAQILSVLKSALASEDPSSLGRIRSATLLPVATAAAICRQHGRSPASLAWLQAFSQPVPDSWVAQEQHDQLIADNQIDLELEEEVLGEQQFEAEQMTFREELMSMPAFSTNRDDDERLKTYIMTRVPSILTRELNEYLAHRTATFAARRQGGAVQSISAEADKTALLRFFGWMERTNNIPEGMSLETIGFMIRPDLGDLAQAYASWLQETQRCRFTTIANYLNGLVSITSYCYANLSPQDEVLNSDPNPLSQIIVWAADRTHPSLNEVYPLPLRLHCTPSAEPA